MSQLPDGRESICKLCLPLPLALSGLILGAIGEALEAEGYTNVTVKPDEGYRIDATPPEEP